MCSPDALILHYSFDYLGGAEKLALETYKTLRDMGYRVGFCTFKPINWNYIKRIYMVDDIEKPCFEKVITKPRIKRFGLYHRLYHYFSSNICMRGLGGVLSINTHGDIILSQTDISYVNFPTFPRDRFEKKYTKFPWNIYYLPYKIIVDHVVHQYIRNTIIVTNSKFTRHCIKAIMGREPAVVYPPVEVDIFWSSDLDRRDDIVVMCGRISPEKRYELAIRIASRLRNVKFYIIGTVHRNEYYRSLIRMREKYGVRNVYIYVNYPKHKQIELYHKAKVFLHGMKYEHFGIAVVEGMASGLVPVVHRSGGPWIDIIDRGKYGLGYSTDDDAIEQVERALSEYDKLAPLSLSRSRSFSRHIFRKKMEKVISIAERYR